MTQHSILSPSSAHRWTRCPASVCYLGSETSEAAAEGTKAHAEAAKCLLTKTEPLVYDVKPYVNAVREVQGKLYVEKKLRLGSWLGAGSFGTADAIVKTENTLHIFDLKYGYNKVDAVDNLQLALYAMGAVKQLRYKGVFVSMTIVQPRIGWKDSWFMTVPELNGLGRSILTLAQQARAELSLPMDLRHYCPSEAACHYCPHAEHCKALTKAIVGNEDLSLRQKFDAIGMVRNWAKAVEGNIMKELESGAEVPGLKYAVTRHGPSRWADPKVLETILGENAYKKELKSPSQVKKELDKETWAMLKAYVEQGPEIMGIEVDDAK